MSDDKNLFDFAERQVEYSQEEPNDVPPPLNVKRRLKTKRKTIAERFAEFDAANPHVFEKLREFALQMKQGSRKRRRYSAKALFERLRWHFDFEVESADEFKINNNFTALYSRKLMEEVPELDGFFATRKRRAI